MKNNLTYTNLVKIIISKQNMQVELMSVIKSITTKKICKIKKKKITNKLFITK